MYICIMVIVKIYGTRIHDMSVTKEYLPSYNVSYNFCLSHAFILRSPVHTATEQ